MNDLVKAYLSGDSLKAVADEYGVSVKGVVKALDLAGIPRRSNKVNSRKYEFNQSYFNTLNSEAAYWLGVIAADGHVAKYKHSSGKVVLTQKATDENYDWLMQFVKSIEYTGLPKKYTSKTIYSPNGVSYYRLTISSDEVFNDLNRYGIVKNKSLILKSPNIDVSLYPHWIRGYFDGDGSASIGGMGIRLRFCGTKEVLTWISEQLPLQKVYWSKRHDDGSNNYGIDISKIADITSTVDYMYNDATIWLPRKRDRCEEFKSKYSSA